MMAIDDAHKEFLNFKRNIENLISEDLSESDTRSKVIDYIFKNILGWDETCIVREGHSDHGYFDYKFFIPRFQFIVEAKKNFAEFSIPAKHQTVTLGTFAKGNQEVINQVRKYLFDTGLQFAIITNGKQFIIGKFVNNDGTDWMKNKCFLFNGLEEIDKRFIEFYNNLSKKAIIENSGFKSFLDEMIPQGKTIISSIVQKDAELIRNSLSAELIPILENIFGELFNYNELSNEELIRECFIENDEIKKNKSEIEKLFGDKPPRLKEVVQTRNTKNITNQIQSEISDYDITQNIDSPKPIIIVGSKGAGKTTFINYLFKNSSNEDFIKNHPFVYVDFRIYSGRQVNSYQSRIFKDILEKVYDNYSELNLNSNTALHRVYFKEINRNDKSIWQHFKESNPDKYNEKLNDFIEDCLKNEENHFYKLSEYLIRERRIRLCIIIDNVDQFNIDVQKDVFLFSQSINRSGKVNVILSLREGYYYQWRNKPPFDAFPSNVYHVSAPSYNSVLQKRIEYALKYLEVRGNTKGVSKSGANVVIDNEAVKDFFISLEKTLFSDRSSDMLSFIENTTFPNIREGLEVFRQFLISGHTQIDEIILRHRIENAKNPIPFWEFIKAVALNNKMYYNHELSTVVNLFIPCDGSRNHFLKIKLLRFLDNKLSDNGQSGRFLLMNEVVETFNSAGYNTRTILSELEILTKYRLIETDDIVSDIEELNYTLDNQNISISAKGHYYLNELKNDFAYLDIVVQDTPIFDNEHYTSIKEVFPISNDAGKRSLELRLETVLRFMKYLRKEERIESVESESIARGIVDEIFDSKLSSDVHRIKKNLRRIESS